MSLKRAFLVNSPFWLAGVWSGIKQILPASVQVDILSASKYQNALREYIDEDQLPPEYGGTSPYKLGEHPYEVELRKLVDTAAANNKFDETSTPPSLLSSSAVPETIATLKNSCDKFTDDLALSSPAPERPLRRRLVSGDLARKRSRAQYMNAGSSERETELFIVATIVYSFWNIVQGALEVTIPILVSSPTYIGGLGYTSMKSGVTMFCACLVLLWTMRLKLLRSITSMPTRIPTRGFRIGTGSQAALLLFLAYTATRIS
jgi:hypothetical protein